MARLHARNSSYTTLCLKPVFRPFCGRGQLRARSYQHELGEVHRLEVWKMLARERSQRFQVAGVRALIVRARWRGLTALRSLSCRADYP